MRAGDARQAFDWTRRAPRDGAPARWRSREAMGRLANAAQALVRAFVASYRDAIGDGTVDGATLSAAMATALEDHLGDPEGALEAHLRVVDRTLDPDSARAAVRIAGSLGRWSVAAQVVARIAATTPPALPALLDALEHAASESAAWNEAAKALSDAAASPEKMPRIGRRKATCTLGVCTLAARTTPATPTRPKVHSRRALGEDPENVELLEHLAELQRRHPDRRMVDTLVALSTARGGVLALLREAAMAAQGALAGPCAGPRPFDSGTRSRACPLGRDEGGENAAFFAQWAIETRVVVEEEEGDASAVVAALTAGDSLPFPVDVRRDMRRRAARVALDRLGDDARGRRALRGALRRRPARRRGRRASRGRVRGSMAARRICSAFASVRSAPRPEPGERLSLRLEAARLLVADEQVEPKRWQRFATPFRENSARPLRRRKPRPPARSRWPRHGPPRSAPRAGRACGTSGRTGGSGRCVDARRSGRRGGPSGSCGCRHISPAGGSARTTRAVVRSACAARGRAWGSRGVCVVARAVGVRSRRRP